MTIKRKTFIEWLQRRLRAQGVPLSDRDNFDELRDALREHGLQPDSETTAVEHGQKQEQSQNGNGDDPRSG